MSFCLFEMPLVRASSVEVGSCGGRKANQVRSVSECCSFFWPLRQKNISLKGPDAEAFTLAGAVDGYHHF